MKRLLAIILSLTVGVMPFLFSGCGPTEQPPATVKISTTTADLRSFVGSDEECIRKIRNAGFRFVDFSMSVVAQENSPYMKANWRDTVLRLKSVADSIGIKFVQAHAPTSEYILLMGTPEEKAKLNSIIVRCIEICEVLEIPNIIVHAGADVDIEKEEWFERNKEAYSEQILPAAERCGVNVLCENFARLNLASEVRASFYLLEATDMREFIEYVNHPNFHGCWDTGHANCVTRTQYDSIITLGEELYAIHYHENYGTSDGHYLLGCGNGRLNNEEIFNALKAINFNGYFNLECNGTDRGNYTYIGPEVDMLKDKTIPLKLRMNREEEEKLLYQVAEKYVELYADGMFDIVPVAE